jgi:predicted nucleic-acid-binding protein
MKAVDTNVLLRFLVEDDRAQTRAARRFLTQECSAQDPCLVNRIVFCEIVWVLDRVYRYPRSEIAAVLDGLVHASELQIEDHD